MYSPLRVCVNIHTWPQMTRISAFDYASIMMCTYLIEQIILFLYDVSRSLFALPLFGRAVILLLFCFVSSLITLESSFYPTVNFNSYAMWLYTLFTLGMSRWIRYDFQWNIKCDGKGQILIVLWLSRRPKESHRWEYFFHLPPKQKRRGKAFLLTCWWQRLKQVRLRYWF